MKIIGSLQKGVKNDSMPSFKNIKKHACYTPPPVYFSTICSLRALFMKRSIVQKYDKAK